MCIAPNNSSFLRYCMFGTLKHIPILKIVHMVLVAFCPPTLKHSSSRLFCKVANIGGALHPLRTWRGSLRLLGKPRMPFAHSCYNTWKLRYHSGALRPRCMFVIHGNVSRWTGTIGIGTTSARAGSGTCARKTSRATRGACSRYRGRSRRTKNILNAIA